ncbi:MAG: IS1 family transposase, partial [Ignisphaera sp.]
PPTVANFRSVRGGAYNALLCVMYPVVYSREKTPLNEAYLKGVENIRNKLI